MLNSIIRNIKKELRIEFRNKTAINVTLSFACITTVSISFIAQGVALDPKVLALLFWIITYFSSMSGLSHIFTREHDQSTLLFLKASSQAGHIYISKLIINILFLFSIIIIITPLFIIFNDITVPHFSLFIAALLSGCLSIASSSTFLAALAALAGGRTTLFTIISFPVILPVLWVVTVTTAASLQTADHTGYGNIVFLLAFSTFIIIISIQLFKLLWDNT